MTDTTTQFKRQLPRNLVFQALSFATAIGIGLALTPYLVRHLGRAAYGLIPIAGAMTQYVGIVTHSISSATARFLAIALQRNDDDEANRIASTAFFSYGALVLIQIPVFALIIGSADRIIDIPDALYWDTIALLVCSVVVFLSSLLGGVFGVPMYACNRLDVSRALEIAGQIARTTGIVVLFAFFGPALRYIGYASLAVSVATTLATVVIGKRLAPRLRLRVRAYDWGQLRHIVGMGGWLLVNHVGVLLFLHIDVWVCNRFINADAAGEYAAVHQWASLIRQAGALLSGVVGPMIVIHYARREMDQLSRLAKVSVRVLSLLLAVPISILCIFSSTILRLWLGESFAPLGALLVVLVCHLTVNVGILPVFGIQTALNKVRVPALVSCAMGALNLALAISFVKFLGWGVYGVAVAGAIVLTAKNAVFTPVYAAAVLKQPWHTFLGSSLSGLTVLAGLTGFGCLLQWLFPPQTWLHLTALAAVIAMVGLIAVGIGVSRKNRRLMVELMPGRFRALATRLLAV